MGNGTGEEREGATTFVEKLELVDDEIMQAQTRLSSVSRYVYVPDCGHEIPIRKPEIIAREVRGVFEDLGVK